MQLPDLDQLVRTAELNLNDAHRHLMELQDESAREFLELKLQSCLFQYDVTVEMTTVLRNQSSGFANNVALKGLLLRLFEYDQLLSRNFIPRLIKLAKARGVNLEKTNIKELRRRWTAEFQQLQQWADVRNEAAGHYSPRVIRQVELLESLDRDQVMSVTGAFLSFNLELLRELRSSGLGGSRE